MRAFQRLLIALALVAASGCTTYATLQRASTLGEGKMQVAIEPSLLVIDGDRAGRADLSIRYGLTESVDVGGRIGFGGLDLFGKFRLTPPGDGLILSVLPTVGLFVLDELAIVNLSLPLLIGVPLGEHELVFGPKVVSSLGLVDTGSGAGGLNVLFGGGSVGLALDLGGMTLLPEVAVVYPLLGTAGDSSGSSSATPDEATPFFQLSVGLLFGGK